MASWFRPPGICGGLNWRDDGGFALRYPRQHTPTQLAPMVVPRSCSRRCRQHGRGWSGWGSQASGALDAAIKAGRSRGDHPGFRGPARTAYREIAGKSPTAGSEARLVLISGPSSFRQRRLFPAASRCNCWRSGCHPSPWSWTTILSGGSAPRGTATASWTYETIEALDLAQLGDHLQRLLAGEEVQFAALQLCRGPADARRRSPPAPGNN